MPHASLSGKLSAEDSASTFNCAMLAPVLPRCRTLPRVLTRHLSNSKRWKHAVSETNESVNALVHTLGPTSTPGTGPLADISIAIKDNICTASMPTTCSSRMLENFSSPYDATVVRLLTEAGAQIVGKANCDEFGMGYV